jgi:hypothetical protein
VLVAAHLANNTVGAQSSISLTLRVIVFPSFCVFDCFVSCDCGCGIVLVHACDICDAGREQERQRERHASELRM